MTFTLHIDGPRWRAHLAGVSDAVPGLVPVIKGNGYGFGNALLAAEAQALGMPVIAVGTVNDLEAVRPRFDGDFLVLTPWHPATEPTVPDPDARVIRTLSSVEALAALGEAGRDFEIRHRVVIEVATSMHRHGVEHDRLAELGPLLDAVDVEGFALHLPIAPPVLGRAEETEAAVARLWGAGLQVDRIWASHLADAELASVRNAHPAIDVRPRIGTRLWLGARETLRPTGTVLDVHALRRGERFGYRQKRAPGGMLLVVVSGGTAHGVGLEAPKPVSGVVARSKVAALGGLEAAGRVHAPFHLGGKQRWFAEPPHMQCSMLLVPDDVEVAMGDELACDVRFTTTIFDRVEITETSWLPGGDPTEEPAAEPEPQPGDEAPQTPEQSIKDE
ncbi:MAG TPA: alanine racemase [Candidatus Limnocylindria bacterium]|nr:alanine racemase [Candidatus Limnocylindria bacterium]